MEAQHSILHSTNRSPFYVTATISLVLLLILAFHIYILYLYYTKNIEIVKTKENFDASNIQISLNNNPMSSRKTVSLGKIKANLVYSLTDKDPRSIYSACNNVSIPKKEHGEVNKDYTDISVRAILLANNNIMLSTGHLVPNKMVGTTFDNLKKDCKPLWYSEFVQDFDKFKFNEWNSSLYTKDGKTILSITQHDWHAGKIPTLKKAFEKTCSKKDNCRKCLDDPFNCWWLALTVQKSVDSGNTFSKMPNYILAAPDIKELYTLKTEKDKLQYYFTQKDKSQAFGYYQTTNIIKDLEKGNYYFVTRARLDKKQPSARFVFCKADAEADLFNPDSWKGQDSKGLFSADIRKSEGIAPRAFSRMTEIRTLVFNASLKKYMAFGFASKNDVKYIAAMFTNSQNILDWNPEVYYITEATFALGETSVEIRYPTLIDHSYPVLVKDYKDKAERRNFDVCGNSPYVYCTVRKTDKKAKKKSNESLDLVRFQIFIT